MHKKQVTKKKTVETVLHDRVCVLVLGMHRSGTSALTGVLNKLGCDLPTHLMAGSKGNEKGFFESTAIRDFNDELLSAGGSSWDDFLKFNTHWQDSPPAKAFFQRAYDLLESEFGTSSLFALKDPRICRLVPFWTQVLERAGCSVCPVLTLRNPLEVSRSLEAKKGFDAPFSQMIWLRNVLDAEASTRQMRRFHTSYEELIESWPRVAERSQEILGLNWPRTPGQIEVEVEEFLSDELRHHKEKPDTAINNPILADWLKDAFKILNQWAVSGENPDDYPRLDQIQAEFNTASLAFSRLVNAQRGQRAELEQKLASFRVSKSTLEAALAEKTAALDKRAEEEKAVADKLGQTTGALEKSKREAAEAATALSVANAALKAEMNRSAEEEKAVADKLGQTTGALEKSKREAAEAATALSVANAALKAEMNRRAEYSAIIAQQERTIQTTKEQLAETNKLARLHHREVSTVAATAARAEEQVASLTALNQRLEERRRDAQEQDTAERKEMEDRLSQTQSALRQRQHETEQTAAALRAAHEALKTEVARHTESALTIARQEGAIQATKEQLAEAKALARQHYREISAVAATAKRAEEQITRMATQRHRVEEQRDIALLHVESLRSSTSWRITAPIRKVALFLRRSK